MRMLPVLALVVSLGLSMMILGGLGVDQFGNEGEVGLEEDINESTDDQTTVNPQEGESGGFISFVISALAEMRDLMALAFRLPAVIESFGAPTIVARAIGHAIHLILAIGLIQIAIQYDIR